MAYQRKQLGSPCALCGAPVSDEAVAVRTLTSTLPYTPKIWHRVCFDGRSAKPAARVPQEPRAACAG